MKVLVAVPLAASLLFACGGDSEKKKTSGPKTVSGFEFEIAIEPTTFAPAHAETVKIASDGTPNDNPPNTVQLYTPNNSLTWLTTDQGAVFGFDVELTNFYETELCALLVVVDEIEPASGRKFIEDDRGSAYAGEVTGAGVWAFGDLATGKMEKRRWKILLENRERFKIRGRVLADEEACGQGAGGALE